MLLDIFQPQQGSRIFSGSMIMLLGSALVSTINFGYNVAMARALGPAQFGHVSAVATLLMLASAISLSFQLVCAKFVARNHSSGGKQSVYSNLMSRAWTVAVIVSAGLLFGSRAIAELLRLPSAWLIVLLAIGIAFSVPLGVKRGALQGLCSFPALTGNFILESLVKLLSALVLVGMGYGIFGAVGAICASVMAAFLFSPIRFPRTQVETAISPASFREGMQAIVFFAGMVVINNIDILLVKSFFPPAEAGLYAAVALFGRLLYFAAWSIISAMFPISAAASDERPGQVLKTPLLLVGGLSALFIGSLVLLPRFLVGLVLGRDFVEADSLLAIYATATAIYSVSVVLMAYEMSRKIANTGWLQLLFSGLMVVGISLFHQSLHQVIMVQIVLMSTLLLTVSLPFLRSMRRAKPETVREAA